MKRRHGAETLITECTFFDADHRTKAKAGKHLHVEQFAASVLPKRDCSAAVYSAGVSGSAPMKKRVPSSWFAPRR